MTTRVLESPHDQEMAAKLIMAQSLPCTVEIRPGKVRSSKQNKLQRKWISEIAEQLDDRTAEEWRGYCKLHYGVAILKAGSDLFREEYDKTIKPLPYEMKLKLMMEPFDFGVTRKMNSKQKKEYLDTIYREFSGMGVELTDPDGFMEGR